MQKRAIFSLFLMISTTLRAVMIYHYSVMDKKITVTLYQNYSYFLVGEAGYCYAEFSLYYSFRQRMCGAMCAALRKIPREVSASFFLRGGGMRHSVRFALTDRPGLSTNKKAPTVRLVLFCWWGKLDSDQRSQ